MKVLTLVLFLTILQLSHQNYRFHHYHQYQQRQKDNLQHVEQRPGQGDQYQKARYESGHKTQELKMVYGQMLGYKETVDCGNSSVWHDWILKSVKAAGNCKNFGSGFLNYCYPHNGILPKFISAEKLVLYNTYNGVYPSSPPIGLVLNVEYTCEDKSLSEVHKISSNIQHDNTIHITAHTKNLYSKDENKKQIFSIENPSFMGMPTMKTNAAVQVESSKPTKNSLRVLSYNTWNFNHHIVSYRHRMDKFTDAIQKCSPDIIGFQEVRLDLNHQGKKDFISPNQVNHLSSKLKDYNYVFQPAMLYSGASTTREEEGLAIFSRYPILSWDYMLLPKNINDPVHDYHQRICLRAVIKVPFLEENLNVYVTHLSLSPTSRNISVYEIWKFMKKHRGPKLLLGDMNSEPNEPAMKFLNGEVDINGVKTKGMKDVWLNHNKEPRAGRFYYQEGEQLDEGLTFSTDDLRKRIDLIYLKGESLESVGVGSIGKEGTLMASDHLGFYVDLQTKPN